MRRTEVLQGLRVMKFEEVYGHWQQRRLSQAEAADLVGSAARCPPAPQAPTTTPVNPCAPNTGQLYVLSTA
jgi:hypothetical protein